MEGVDAVIVGDGEAAVASLVELWSGDPRDQIPSVPGVASRRGLSRAIPLDVSALPMPDRRLVDLTLYEQQGAILTSRGCTRRCYFCSATGRLRNRGEDLVIAEIGELHEVFGVRHAELLDNAFLHDVGRARLIGGELARRGMAWSATAMVRDVLAAGEATVRALAQAGLVGAFFGVESGSDRILRKVKGVSRDDVRRAVDLLRSAGVPHLVTSFVLGHPWDTEETVDETMSFALELAQSGVHTPVSILVPYPGTPLGDHPERFGVRVHDHDLEHYSGTWATLDTRHLTAERIQMKYVEALDALSRVGSPTGLPS